MSAFVHQLRWEQLVFWRSREAAIFVFVFPLLLYVLLATVYGGEVDGRPAASYLLVGLLAYGVANTLFGGLAISLVLNREYGRLKRLRATPLRPATYLAAAVTSSALVFALQVVVLVLLGRGLFDAALPERPLAFVAALVLAALAFAGLGIGAAALIRSAEGSSAVVNVVLLPMAFLAGSFGPTRDLPAVLQTVGEALPLRHALELLEAAYLDGESLTDHGRALAVLAAWGAAGTAVAARRFRWAPRTR